MIRIITFSSFNEHTKSLYVDVNILPVPKIFFQNVCLLVFKELNTDVPIKFHFKLCSSTHSYNTRKSKSGHLYNYTHNTNYYVRSFFNVGVKFYNILPFDTINAKSLYVFKKRLRAWLNDNDVDLYEILCINTGF